MALKITPDMLAAVYDLLSVCPPFNKWNMPDSEDVKFQVIRTKDRTAHYCMRKGVHIIAVSSAYVGRHEMLISSVAHEMIHLHMAVNCWNRRNPHDAAFQKFADQVCRVHEFDRLTF